MARIARTAGLELRRPAAGWLVAALATAGGVGALTLFNRLSAATTEEQPGPALAAEQHRYAWKHGDIFYTVKGRGEPLVLVHGIYPGASSFEYRRVFESLALDHRVYAFDLLGFGLSDRPAIGYTPDLYIRLIQDFTREVVGGMDQPVRLIASGRGAAFAIHAAETHPGLFDRLILVEPTGANELMGLPEGLSMRALTWFLRTPLLGEAIYNIAASRPSIRRYLRRAYADPNQVSDDVIDHYYASAHQRGGRFAPASLLVGRLDIATRAAFARLRLPMLLLWGTQARLTPLAEGTSLREANPRADVRLFAAGAFPHHERPAEFARLVNDWLRVPTPRGR